VAAGVELACSQFVTMHRLLWETLAMVGQDILQLAWVSIKWEGKKPIYLTFSGSSSFD
jgi:hypothetical protein